MKKTKIYPINYQYFAVVEFENNEVLIWIEERCKFLWIFNSSKRVSCLQAITLVTTPLNSKYPDIGYTLHGVFAGRTQTLDFKPILLHQFNLKSEVDTLYHSFIKSQSEGLKRAKLIDNIINQLD